MEVVDSKAVIQVCVVNNEYWLLVVWPFYSKQVSKQVMACHSSF